MERSRAIDVLDAALLSRDDVAAFTAGPAGVLARGDAESDRVAVVSGGGSGHEPAHAGYVGAGMLTAAVCGEVFTSPPVDAVLAGLTAAVPQAEEFVLIVKNYTGDVLNFSLAAEIARSEGKRVEQVIVGDDVALLDQHSPQEARGLAGTVLVHKIAGAAAAEGMALAEVARLARDAAGQVWTLGVGYGMCTLPGAATPPFPAGQMEWGLGIHGEPGARRTEALPLTDAAEVVVGELLERSGVTQGQRVAVLVNQLGGLSGMQTAAVERAALTSLRARGIDLALYWSGTYLTALDMPGFSVSIMRLDAERERLLLEPCNAPGWHRPTRPRAEAVDAFAMPGDTLGAGPYTFAPLVHAVCDELARQTEPLNAKDRLVGDGDIGTSLAHGAAAVAELAASGATDPDSPGEFFARASRTVRRSMGGTSGPLYAGLLLGAANAYNESDPPSLADVFAKAVRTLVAVGGAQPGDRTMVDALDPASGAFAAAVARGATVSEALDAAAAAAERGAAATSGMAAGKGRSRYVADTGGHVDPGAHAVAVWLRALANACAP